MKMRMSLTCGAVVALLCLTATAGFATNVLTNPGFETGDLTGWQVFGLGANSSVTVVADNGPSQGGTHCVYMDNHAEALGLTMKQTTAPGTGAPGLVYWSFDLKAGPAAVGGVFFVQVFAEQTSGGIVATSGLLGNYATAGWNNYSGSFMAPATTGFMTIQFMCNTGAATGSISKMYVDNVAVSQQPIVPDEPTSWGAVKGLFR